MSKKTPDTLAREVLLRAGVDLEKLLPLLLRAIGPEHTGEVAININFHTHCGGIKKVRSAITINQAQ